MDPTTTPANLNGMLQLAAQGDTQAWRGLVEAFSSRVFALVLKQCGDKELAEEITQATFVQVVRNLNKYREFGKFEPWLFRIAMNQLRDEMRRRKRQAQPMDMSESRGAEDESAGWSGENQSPLSQARMDRDGPLETASRTEEVELLKEAVASLNEADREILYMRHTAGLSFGEIAESLGQPLGTVLARGHRALAKVKKLLQDRGL